MPSFPLVLIKGKFLTLWPSFPQPKQLPIPTNHSPIFFLPHLAQVGFSLAKFQLPPFSDLGLDNLSLLSLGKLEGTWLETLFLNLGLS